MAKDIPRYPSGHSIGKPFADTDDPFGLKLGLITRIDEINLKCDVKILTGGGGDRYELDITQAMTGARSFWGGIPEVSSLVIIGYRRRHKNLQEAVILGYVPTGSRAALRFDPVSSDDPAEVDQADQELYEQLFGAVSRRRRLMLRPGDVGGLSSSGSEFTLTKDVRMSNRAGDLFELRDAERSFVAQSIHRVESEAGVFRISGPIRRGGFYTPSDILRADGKTLKDAPDPDTGQLGVERYFGRGLLKRFTNGSNVLLDSFNNATNFPPVTYSNSRRVHYPVTSPGVNFEDLDPDNTEGAEPFTEWRMEMSHSTDMVQESREEIDGFQMDRRPVFIEHVLGTIVGNDTSSETGLQQYGRLLKPKVFDEFQSTSSGVFTLEEVPRLPTDDTEAYTTAGAYLFRINPPPKAPIRATDNSVFAVAVSKQGKLFVNIPGSKVERYPSGTKNVSAEINMEGALKMRLGAARPDGVALHLTLEGSAIFDFRGGASGQGLQFRSHSSMNFTCQGPQDAEGNAGYAWTEDLQGNRYSACSADSIQSIGGTKQTTVNGLYGIQVDRWSLSANSGESHNVGQFDFMCSGKSQYNYALQVLENIVTGGKVSTILAGGLTETILAGARAITVAAGAMTTAIPAGSYSVTVGAGSLTLSAGAGAVSISSGGGAISQTAGLGMTLTAGLAITLTSPISIVLSAVQVLLGSAVAPLGVCRGAPMMPPGSPSLDWITGLPLQGSALVRSI